MMKMKTEKIDEKRKNEEKLKAKRKIKERCRSIFRAQPRSEHEWDVIYTEGARKSPCVCACVDVLVLCFESNEWRMLSQEQVKLKMNGTHPHTGDVRWGFACVLARTYSLLLLFSIGAVDVVFFL